MATLYLIPNLLGSSPWQNVLPGAVPATIASLSCFIVEDIRNARRFLKKINPAFHIDSCIFFELNAHTPEEKKPDFIRPLLQGRDVGLISEAGCPGVADPGAEIVRAAHRENIRVVPLVGPSSILLALMASGLNGQNFAFSGYLPVKSAERIRKILQLEKTAFSLGQTQVFMETPYRNDSLLRDILKSCHASTLLCVAADLTSESEMVVTKTVSAWIKQLPELNKRQVIYLLGNP